MKHSEVRNSDMQKNQVQNLDPVFQLLMDQEKELILVIENQDFDPTTATALLSD